MAALGYSTMASFERVINRAVSACATLNISPLDHFRREDHIEESGKSVQSYRLSRFACYLTAMNADPKKPQVARAQMYFATLAESVRNYMEEASQMDRLLTRREVTEHEKTLSGIVHMHGIVNFAFFQNAGYRGLYGMNLKHLRAKKFGGRKMVDQNLLNYMGKTELAANLFRVTQTEEKIKKENIRGQQDLEQTHESVGRQVRAAMMRISGTLPENLPLEPHIKEVRKSIKTAHKRLVKMNGKKSGD